MLNEKTLSGEGKTNCKLVKFDFLPSFCFNSFLVQATVVAYITPPSTSSSHHFSSFFLVCSLEGLKVPRYAVALLRNILNDDLMSFLEDAKERETPLSVIPSFFLKINLAQDENERNRVRVKVWLALL